MKVSLNNSSTIALKTFDKAKTAQRVNAKAVNPIAMLGVGVASVLGQAVVNNVKMNRKTNEAQVDCLLKKNGYVYSRKDDTFTKRYRPEQINSINKSKDEFENKKMELLTLEPITKEDVKGFTEFLNLGYGKALTKVDTDFDGLMASYLKMKRNGLFENHKALAEENPEYQNIVLKPYFGNVDASAKNALMNYKIDAHEIDKCISSGKEAVDGKISEKIEALSRGLDANRVQNNVKVFWTCNADILNTVKAQDGFTCELGSHLVDVQKAEDNSTRNYEIDALRNFVANNELTIKQESFTRTTLNKPNYKDNNPENICWELEVSAGSKGAYLEPYNMKNVLSSKNEFLVDKNSTITLKGLDFDRSNNCWIVRAEISSR